MYINQQTPNVVSGAQLAQSLAPQTQPLNAATSPAALAKSPAQKPQLVINRLFQLSSSQPERLSASNTTTARFGSQEGEAPGLNSLGAGKPTALQTHLIKNLARSLATQGSTRPVRFLPTGPKTVDVTPILGQAQPMAALIQKGNSNGIRLVDQIQTAAHAESHRQAFGKTFQGIPSEWHEIVRLETADCPKGKLEFRCKYPGCQAIFKKSGNLRDHFRKHTKQRPFQCSFCEKNFTQSSNLGRHLKNVHQAPRTAPKIALEKPRFLITKEKRGLQHAKFSAAHTTDEEV